VGVGGAGGELHLPLRAGRGGLHLRGLPRPAARRDGRRTRSDLFRRSGQPDPGSGIFVRLCLISFYNIK